MRLSFAIVALLLLSTGCAVSRPTLRIDSPYQDLSSLANGEILHAATGRSLTEPELFEYLSSFPVVYVGETHDNADDHMVQLKVLKSLSERFPGRVALGLEMLQSPSQAKVDAFLRGEMTEKDFMKVWAANWGASYFDYREILYFCRETSIPIVALNAPKDLEQEVRAKGFGGPNRDRLPEIRMDDPYYREFVAGMSAGHPMGSNDPETFYRIQVLRDESMAQAAAEYLQSAAGKGRRIAVFAGGGHVYHGFGVPRRLYRRVPLPYVVVEPFANRGEVEIPKEKLMDVTLPVFPMRAADVYWSVGYQETKRVMLGITIEEAEGKGVRVAGLIPGSPAEKAGVRKGDLVVSIDGKPVRDSADLTLEVVNHKPGDVGPLEVEREGQRVALTVTYAFPEHGR